MAKPPEYKEMSPAPPWPPTAKEIQQYEVSGGDSLEYLAARVSAETHKQCSWSDLARLNFGTTRLGEVNWCLNKFVGCQDVAGPTYVCTGQEEPGVLYLPRMAVPDPAPSQPNKRRAIRRRPSRNIEASNRHGGINSGCPRIAEYIAVVRRLESAVPDLRRKPHWMATFCRMMWSNGTYNSVSWRIMLPKARLPWSVFATAYRACLKLSKFERQIFAQIDCLRTPQHHCTDFGHVLTGIDGTKYPSNYLTSLKNGDQIIAGVTWSGDVGSVYRQVLWHVPAQVLTGDLHQLSRKKLTERLQYNWPLYASDEDLLGDIDGVVLGKLMLKRTTFRFSETLREHYRNSHTQAQIFSEFEKIHSTDATNVKDLTYAWIKARAIAPHMDVRVEWMLDWLADKFRSFIKDGKAGKLSNKCSKVRVRAADRARAADQAAKAAK